jgi:hypothetical protein
MTRIVDINVTTMHRRLLLKPLRQRQLLDATLSIQALPGSRAKLTHMRTFADCRYDMRYVICILNS